MPDPRRQHPETIPFTPEWRAKVEALARGRDPFFGGAQWMLDTLDQQPAGTQPPHDAGASSCPTLAQRKDTP